MRIRQHFILMAVAAFYLGMTQADNVRSEETERKAFRVCQDPNNMPLSSLKGEGYENKIAELFAKDLGLPVEYYSFPQRMGFIRNTLRYKLPGESFRCDIVMGVPAGFDQVSATKPYFRSTYALVFPKNGPLASVRSGDDFGALPQVILQQLRIGLFDRTPPSEWLARRGLVSQGIPYRILNADPDQYPGEIIEKDLAAGKIDVAIVWGPIAGFFSKRVKAPELAVVPLKSEPGLKFDFEMAMGVRYGEKSWKDNIESLIEKNRTQIQSILLGFGIPLIDASGRLVGNESGDDIYAQPLETKP